LLLMAVGVLAVSTSAPLIAVMTVPPLAISFWRNGFATAAMTPGVLTHRRGELAGLGRRQIALVVASGLALAVHFGTWVTSVRLTSVAASTALVCLQIGWVVAWQLVRGHRFGRGVIAGLVVAFVGVLIVSGVDVTVSTRALVGDLLALAGGIAAAAYMLIGSRARQTMTTTAYTWVCYGSCAAALVVACVVSGQPLGGYPLGQWGLLLVTTATAQLLGHSVFNHLLATTSPVLVSLALLLEVPGASLIAAFFLGQRPPLGTLVGLAVLLAGMALVIVNNHGPALRQPPVD
ncbi:MAG: DMT family transporter, partial [Nocardioidaceae bacterium]